MLSSVEFHKDFAALRVNEREIAVNGLVLKEEISSEALSALIFEPKNIEFSWRCEKNVVVNARITRENDHGFLLDLNTSLSLTCTCVRCLEPVSLAMEVSFAGRLLESEHLGLEEHNAETAGSFDISVDLSEEADDVAYFSGKTLDLGIVLRDQIFLMVPDYPHCGMSKDALSASGCAFSPSICKEQEAELRDNPFVKRFGKNK